MKKENKKQLYVRDPQKAWETLHELIFADEDMTTEELDDELRKYGIEPSDSVRRLFELAQRLSRESHAGGTVSPYVSEILSQLTSKCHRAEAKTTTTQASRADQHPQGSIKANDEISIPINPKARAAVLNYHRNYREETENDRAIRLKNEKRLQEMAEKIEQQKNEPKK